ncbi:MAG TPA: RsmE family RNA methyltransferase [Caldisericia bacterium]|nr:RsmE family RNA methyltransferase [Caldisericia bacterium]HPF49522.1 RsmE family RNA methyltransferase [Caldisericia bacterium]HPI84184.1 RsmE family RNA methyltransferase [Caldisericia bacterium]HPQ93521.1 RsmE family RNA methyltransferase [Caldisericia bacterium]HRV75473.1 RsmE family RNA methyltransferase [Caldisericia bacterium]
MHLFYTNDSRTIKGDDFHHAINVLRLGVGDEVVSVFGLGERYLARIARVDKSSSTIELDLIEKLSVSVEPPVNINLIQALTRPDKLGEIVESCTQLGVSTFQMIITKRCEHKLKGERLTKKIEHLRRIAKSGAALAGREIIPEVLEPVSFEQALANSTGLKLIPWELARDTTIKKAIDHMAFDSVSVVIGPEGGFEISEVEMAKELGFTPITLGPRILRAQLAPVVAISQILGFVEGLS